MLKRILSEVVLIIVPFLVSAQTTKVRGVVRDSSTGEPLPFVGVYFKGTSTGTSTDLNGAYSLETKSALADTLVCQILGYEVQEKKVRKGAFTEMDFSLVLTDYSLSGAVVKADNRKIKRLLANIEAHRDRNDPDRHRYFNCDIYNKIELDLTHPREQLKGKNFNRQLSFVFDYIDTSSVSGIPYLPVMISESVVRRHHSLSPPADNEEIIANRISGINPDANLLSQFTGSMHLKVNFYKPFINSFDVEFPSPIHSSGLLYYNYYIIDTLQVEGRKTYYVRYHPKEGISSPALDGDMRIDAEDFALRSIHGKMKRGGNVNWLRDVVIDAEYIRFPDSTWFYGKDKLYADFSLALGDSSKMLSVIGTRELTYSNPDFSSSGSESDGRNGPVKVLGDSNYHDEAYWSDARPNVLSPKEQDIYQMVDRIKGTRLYKNWYDAIYTLINGYWDIGPIGIGPYSKLVSYNNLEGHRLNIGIHTSKDLSRKFRWTGFIGFGTSDKEFKGGLSYERMFSKEPTSKLTLDARYDTFQFGKGTSVFTDGNFLASIFGRGKASRPCTMTSFSATYEHEFFMSLNMEASLALKRYFENPLVPMGGLGSIATNEAHIMLRYSKDETVNRGHFQKLYLHTRYPVVSLDLTGSVPGIRKGDVGFFRPELTVDWKVRIPPVGMSKLRLNLGTVIGEVPYPLLHLHEGNGTYILDKTAFSCMDYFEFASDTWATLFWNHNFNGFFFGKIPFLKKLQLREEFTFRATWGHLSEKNASSSHFPFPEGLKALGNVPYVEIGAGISNILRLLRVDFVWRLTHRDEARQNFSVNLGLEFRF